MTGSPLDVLRQACERADNADTATRSRHREERAEQRAAALAQVETLVEAARVFRDHALPHEHLFDGQDLRRFEQLDAALAPFVSGSGSEGEAA